MIKAFIEKRPEELVQGDMIFLWIVKNDTGDWLAWFPKPLPSELEQLGVKELNDSSLLAYIKSYQNITLKTIVSIWKKPPSKFKNYYRKHIVYIAENGPIELDEQTYYVLNLTI